jgi:hypothetical protein
MRVLSLLSNGNKVIIAYVYIVITYDGEKHGNKEANAPQPNPSVNASRKPTSDIYQR